MQTPNTQDLPFFKIPNETNFPALQQFISEHEISYKNINADKELEKLTKECDAAFAARNNEKTTNASNNLPKETLLMANAAINCNFTNAKKLSNYLPAISIDAGGTNLRVVIVAEKKNINNISNNEEKKYYENALNNSNIPKLNGNIQFLYYQKSSIPGSTSHTTASKFVKALVNLVKPALNHPSCKNVNTLHFCFSYPVTFNNESNAIVGTLTKEMQIDGLAGMAIDATLKKAINKHYGYNRINEIIILNDTSATLLSNLSRHLNANLNNNENSISLGLVLGTGFNIAYMGKSHVNSKEYSIYNTEIGNYTGFKKNTIDLEIEKISDNPGKGRTEKTMSGSYLGKQASIILKKACESNLLPSFNTTIPMGKLYAEDIAAFFTLRLAKLNNTKNNNSKFSISILQRISGLLQLPEKKQNIVHTLFFHIIQRASLIAAISTSAIIAHSKKNNPTSTQTLLNLNGSVILLLPHFKQCYISHMESLKSTHNTEIKYIVLERAPTIGSVFAKKQSTKKY